MSTHLTADSYTFGRYFFSSLSLIFIPIFVVVMGSVLSLAAVVWRNAMGDTRSLSWNKQCSFAYSKTDSSSAGAHSKHEQ